MADTSPQPSSTYLQLRQRLLNLNPEDLGLAPSAAAPDVWGMLVELGYQVGSAILVALADGTSSLHYSTGGGMLGRPNFAPLSQAAQALVIDAQKYLPQAEPATDNSLPSPGQVRFLWLTYQGTYAASAPEESLASGRNTLSPLYQRTQDALALLRPVADKKRR